LPLSERHTVLLLPLEGRLDDLSGRLLLVHYRGRVATTTAEAERMLRSEVPPIRAALVSSEPAVAELPRVLQALREAARMPGLRFIAVGPRPSDEVRKRLRAAGVDWALYDAFTDTELRFLLNQASHDALKGERRDELRVPTTLVATVKTPMGTKVAMVYNLSSSGAYLETLRPSQAGARLSVELPLPSGTLEIEASVISTNVTGNLRRENLPRGMGVRFEGLARQHEAALEHFIEERATAFQP
jgi:hypothetical protein